MKRRYIFVAATLLGLGLGSCSDYLNVDKYFRDRQTVERTFQSKDYTDQWMAAMFSKLKGDNEEVCGKTRVPFNFADDMYWGDWDNSYVMFKTAVYNEDYCQATWQKNYESIRDASTLIDNIHMNLELTDEEKLDYIAQARFLRAYYYWILLRRYGPIPLVPVHGLDYTAEYAKLELPRSSYDDCVEFLTNELAMAAKDLSPTRTNRETAKPTRGAALATRAKILLFAASPLFNGNTELAELTDDTGKQLISQEYDEKKWAKAAAAAKDVMELGQYHIYTAPFKTEQEGSRSYPATIAPPQLAGYSDKNFPTGTGFDKEGGWADIDPYESYRALFNGDLYVSANPEIIFTSGRNQTDAGIETMVLHHVPFSVSGWGVHGMTLKQCDAYYMDNGTDVPGMHDYMEPGYPDRNMEPRVTGYIETNEDIANNKPLLKGVSKQYAHREPRFYASVAYNGSMWDMTSSTKPEQRYQQIFWYRATTDGFNTENVYYLRTGIGIKKFLNPQDSWREGGTRIPKADPRIRYADILMIYAEALNELDGTYDIPSWDGTKTHTIKREKEAMKMAMLPIRLRAGLPNYEDGIYEQKALFRKALKRERQIELFAEGYRYYDIRRWKDAPREEATPIYGCNMNMTVENRDLFYRPRVVSSLPTVFSRKTYLWPLSHDELKRNKRLTQNPGWTKPY